MKKLLIQGSLILFSLTFSSCISGVLRYGAFLPNDYEINVGSLKEKGGINADFSMGFAFDITDNLYTTGRYTFAQRRRSNKFLQFDGKFESMSQFNHIIGYNLFYDNQTPFIEISSNFFEMTNFQDNKSTVQSTGYTPTNLRLGYDWGGLGALIDFKIGKTKLEKSYDLKNPSFSIGLRYKFRRK